jgi:hypothetical protein
VSIDGLLDNTFTMEIQTNSYVSAYQLLIVDFDNNEIYTGSKTTLTNYAYNGDTLEIPVNASTVALSNGTNYKWRVRLYQPTADMLITYGLVQATSTTTTIYLQPNINIKAGMAITINSQTKTISSYNSDTGVAVVSSAFSSAPAVGTQYKIYSDFIETVPDYIVYARRTPAVAISNVPSSLTLKYHTFQGTYTQSDNVAIVYHQFDLYTRNDDGTISLVASSDKVYSANLSYTYDSFRTGNKYLIQMTVENDMGIISTTDMYEFTVSYDIVEYLQQPLASFDDKNNAVKVSWVTPVENEAVSNSSGATSGTIQDGANSLTQAVFEDNQTLGNGDQVQITANVEGKNLILLPTQTLTLALGLNRTLNLNSMSLNGTTTSSGEILGFVLGTYAAGTYSYSQLLSGGFSFPDTSNAGFAVYIKDSSKTTTYITAASDNTRYNLSYNQNFTLTEDTELYLQVFINSQAIGTVFTNSTFNFQIAKGADIATVEPYRTIGTRYTGVINSYNATTGVGTMLADYPFTYTPMPGDTYRVLSNIYNNTGFQYLYNTPYNTVNSLYTHGYTATWSTPDGLCVLPDDFNITLQFSPDGNFFYDQNGVYQEVVNLITTETDDANSEGEFTIKIDKNKLIFVQNPDISLELPFYTNTSQVFVLSSANIAQINNDYIWDDTATWTDTYTWVEGGTSLERVCNHWWKVQITNTGIKIEEIFPTT